MAKQGSISISPGKIAKAYERLIRSGSADNVVARIMKREAAVFTKDAKVRKLIANRLGWVDSASWMKPRLAGIEKFGAEVIHSGIKHVVLMGMGGSSLCPDLFGRVHRKHPSLKSFTVLDSTDPAAIKAVARKLEPKKTLFIVASKSGGTVETRSHEAFFQGWLVDNKVQEIGRHFVAITDAGSGLQKSARKLKYRKIFVNPSDIGGRYSALSYFGLVPAFFAGADIRGVVDDAHVMQKLLAEREGELNPALAIGSIMTAGSKAGLDKLTFVASKKTAPLVPWIEQLVAESTGKNKKGVIPIEGEPIGDVSQCRDDRVLVFIKQAGEIVPEHDAVKQMLGKKHCPMIDIVLGTADELGRQFLLWEAATAVTGYQLKINPFDEPNVTESKNNTQAILAAFERAGTAPSLTAKSRWDGLSLVAYGGREKFRTYELESMVLLIRRLIRRTRLPQYLAVLNYLTNDRRTETAISKIRLSVRKYTGMATIRGYGPRYLHSVGQLYKGGPATGRFIVFVRSRYGKLPIPGKSYDFGQLIAAQAIGDVQALIKRGLPTLVIAIDGDPGPALERFYRAINRALR
jgi:glucose-6-phosphate isomerase